MASKCHVYHVRRGDWRVRVKFRGKWRDHGGSFPTKEQAEAHCRSISGPETTTKRSKPKRRSVKRSKKVGWRYRLRRAWRRMMKRRRKK